MKEFLRWNVEKSTAPLHQVVAALEVKTESRRAEKSAAIFAATDDRVVREARTAQICQTLRASTALQTCAAGDACMAQWCSTLFRES